MAINYDILVVGGGGGGGGGVGGGGGGGSVEAATLALSSGTSYPVTIGAGGAGGNGVGNGTTGTKGENSYFAGLLAYGGGGGGAGVGSNATSGGSGGGAGYATSAASAGSGSNVYGGGANGGNYYAGGGGGASQAGAAAGGGFGGKGGDGYTSTISGASVVYGGGGGGPVYLAGTPGAGGAGGGGAGVGPGLNITPNAGTANTGGGGGGGAAGGGTPGGAGGSGVVIVRYLTASVTTPGTGGTITTSGGYTIHTFTSSGTFTAPTITASAPTSLAAGTPTEEAIPLTWTDAASPVTRTLLYRYTSDNSASATLVGAVDSGVQAFTAGGLASSTQYYFWAKSMTADGTLSSFTTSVNATTAAQDAGFVTPGTPTGLAAGTPAASSIPLTWTDGANTAWIHVYQNTSNDSGSATLVEVAAGGTQAVTVYGLSQSTTYYFWLKAVSSSGVNSSFTSSVNATTSAAVSTPTSLSATATGRETIRLTWTDGSGTEAQLVYRHTADSFGGASVITGVDAGVQLYDDTGLATGTQYYYWLLPLGTGGAGSQTSSVNATTIGAAGNAGTNMVEQIVDAFNARLSAQLPTDWHKLKYARSIEKNDKIGRDRGYGTLPKSAARSEASVFQSYTMEQGFEVVLTKGVRPGKGDSAVAAAELDLYTWMDRITREVKSSKLYLPTVVVKIAEPEIDEPEYLEDEELVVLRATFPVTYRNTLS